MRARPDRSVRELSPNARRNSSSRDCCSRCVTLTLLHIRRPFTFRLFVLGAFVSAFLLRLEPPSALPTPAGGPLLLATEAVTPLLRGLAGVTVADANNNLDVTQHEGRYYLAFRTAPTHFASRDARLYVVSSTDERHWRFETEVELGRDLREPRLLSWDGSCTCTSPCWARACWALRARKMMGVARQTDGSWSQPARRLPARLHPLADQGPGRHARTWWPTAMAATSTAATASPSRCTG